MGLGTKAWLNEWEAGPPASLPFNEALCVNEQRETHTMRTSRIVPVARKTTGGERGKKPLPISFHCNYISLQGALHSHGSRDVGVRVCNCEAHLIFTYSDTHYPLFLHRCMLHKNSNLPLYPHKHTHTCSYAYIHW